MEIYNNSNSKSVQIGSSLNNSFLHFIHDNKIVGYFRVLEDGNSEVSANKLNNLNISWEYSNELGKFVLCGE